MKGFVVGWGEVAEIQSSPQRRKAWKKVDLPALSSGGRVSCDIEQSSFDSSQLHLKISLELAREKRFPIPDFISGRYVSIFEIG
jgi:hypothetical protein